MLVAICIPHGGLVSPQLQRVIWEMQVAWPQHQYINVEVDLQIIGKARNMLIETGMGGSEADIFWFIDNDTFVPPHAGQLIDQAAEWGIVSGLYFSRRLPYTPQAYLAAYEDDLLGMYWPLLHYPAKGMMVVDAVGGGCLAVRRDVFTKLQDVYKRRMDAGLEKVRALLAHHPDALNEFEWMMKYGKDLSPWFEFLDRKGEDLYFCERAKDAGYTIWLNVDVKCAHLGEIEFVEHHFLNMRDSGLINIEPVETPGADELEVHGAEEPDDRQPEDSNIPGSRAETVEWSDNLPGGARRIGVMYNLPG